MRGKSTVLSLLNREKTFNVRKVYIAFTLYCGKPSNVRKIYIVISFVNCGKTSNVRKIYIAISFVLWKDIQCQESLLPTSGMCALLSPLFYSLPTKSFNTRKIHIAVNFILCEDIPYQESLHSYHFCTVRKHPMTGKSTFLCCANCED